MENALFLLPAFSSPPNVLQHPPPPRYCSETPQLSNKKFLQLQLALKKKKTRDLIWSLHGGSVPIFILHHRLWYDFKKLKDFQDQRVSRIHIVIGINQELPSTGLLTLIGHHSLLSTCEHCGTSIFICTFQGTYSFPGYVLNCSSPFYVEVPTLGTL